MISYLLPIGPLLASNRSLGKAVGSFWPEDSACLQWLDQQQPRSTIYVAFGSFTIFDQTKFQELALGLELTNRPFLWVVRQDTITREIDQAYPRGFKERVMNRGNKMFYICHASVVCFVSHCGWNSTIEGISNGISFLCWPYFADRFLNQSYILDHWGVGLGLDKDEDGIIRHDEIKDKVEELIIE